MEGSEVLKKHPKGEPEGMDKAISTDEREEGPKSVVEGILRTQGGGTKRRPGYLMCYYHTQQGLGQISQRDSVPGSRPFE